MVEGSLSELPESDPDWHKKGAWERIWSPFADAFLAARIKKQPYHVSFHFMRYYMHLVYLWPTKPEDTQRSYFIINRIIMSILLVFLITITCDLFVATGDIVRLGDDLVVLVGLYLIYLKFNLFWNRRDKVGTIIDTCDELHQKFAAEKDGDDCKICYWQRIFYIYEIISFPVYYGLGVLLWFAVSFQPLITVDDRPFRVLLPYQLHDAELHPNVGVAIYTFQVVCTAYALGSLILFDSIGCHSFAQCTLNLKILSVRLRKLGIKRTSDKDVYNDLRDIVFFHQQIIDLVEAINQSFDLNYIAQMGASTFMICLTAFETLLAKDEPMVALKFEVYMFCAFMQLFYWCFLGNMTYYESLQVADAAFDVHRWYDHAPRVQRQLIFVMERAQSPLTFRASPFPTYTFETFMNILSTSYSYFALLRTMND